MPQNNRLQFSVEESICFQKGQEVSELLSISLDPDITVQEVNDYVSIRGSLEPDRRIQHRSNPGVCRAACDKPICRRCKAERGRQRRA